MASQIVIVHGDESECALLSNLLKQHGLSAQVFTQSPHIEYLARVKPDCILLDYCRDTTSCVQLIATLRQDAALKNTPIILLARSDIHHELESALDAGADVFVLQPYHERHLISQIKAQMRVRQSLSDSEARLAQAQQNLTQLHADISLGQQVLTSFLPPNSLQSPNFNLEARLIAGGDLSGDYFDYKLLSPDQLVLFLADVSGHGVASALLASRLKALFDQNLELANKPRSFLEHLNREIINLGEHYHIATALLVYIDMLTKTVYYASAGHRTMYWLDCEGDTAHTMPATGPALGMFEEFELFEQQRSFTPGRNRLVAFTDGLVEFRSSDGNWITELDFCTKVLFPNAALALPHYVDELLHGSSDLAGSGKWEDDVSLFAVDF